MELDMVKSITFFILKPFSLQSLLDGVAKHSVTLTDTTGPVLVKGLHISASGL
jgi:hypothetical protein